jgi:hypothetical protein
MGMPPPRTLQLLEILGGPSHYVADYCRDTRDPDAEDPASRNVAGSTLFPARKNATMLAAKTSYMWRPTSAWGLSSRDLLKLLKYVLRKQFGLASA